MRVPRAQNLPPTHYITMGMRATQTVNGSKGIHVMLAKSLLHTARHCGTPRHLRRPQTSASGGLFLLLRILVAQ